VSRSTAKSGELASAFKIGARAAGASIATGSDFTWRVIGASE